MLKEINLLYVEDENDIREFTTKAIGSVFNKMVTAKNGEDGLKEYFDNPDINLILTDINMSKMGGLEMCKEIRKKDKETPIVVVSAHVDSGFLKKAIDLKVSAYAIKPIDLYKLIENITIAFEPIYLRKKLDKVNSFIDSKTKRLKALIDAQDNIVVFSSLDKILDVNKKFLEFFNIKSLKQFQEEENWILDKFKESDGFLSSSLIKDKKNWILEIKNLDEINRIIKMDDVNQKERIFVINIDDYKYEEDNKYIISFIDITNLKSKSNLMEYKITHDQFTGFFNRIKFKDILTAEVHRAKRYKNLLSLVTFKIDDFENFEGNIKTSNEIIEMVSKLVLHNTREQDIPVRWTKKEFLILLPQTNIEGAIKVCEKINMEVKNHIFKNTPKHPHLSFGISELKDDEDEKQILRKSRKGLEEAIKNSKDKIGIF